VIESSSPKAGLFAHGYTYSAHPVGAAAALAALKAIDDRKVVETSLKSDPISIGR